MSLLAAAALHGLAPAQALARVRFRQACQDPSKVQWRRLRQLLRRHRQSAFGREHGFDAIDGPRAWRAQVPLRTYDDLLPWLERVRTGEAAVLTDEPVQRLLPTGGSSGGRKLIPWTAGLAGEFQAALQAWLGDLGRRAPGVRGGPAYWSLSPALPAEPGPVPIGFDDDSAYLGGIARRLIAPTLVAPDGITRLADAATFRYVTALHLLACRDLRLVSIWHPDFFTAVLRTIEEHKDRLLVDLADGDLRPPAPITPQLRQRLRLRSMPQRARIVDDGGIQDWWPRLAVVSCWTHGAAALPAQRLAQALSGVPLQSKGLLATEGVVTIPLAGRHPLALTSHVYEFLDRDGRVWWPDELRTGASYEVVLTTGGGLYRYRLGDRVRVVDWLDRCPCLRFLCRRGEFSDLVGEKLDGAFVATTLARRLPADCGPAALRPRRGVEPGYDLLCSSPIIDAELLRRLDHDLRANPHYAWARDLGQLGPLRLVRADPETGDRQRLGDRKPRALLPAVTRH